MVGLHKDVIKSIWHYRTQGIFKIGNRHSEMNLVLYELMHL